MNEDIIEFLRQVADSDSWLRHEDSFERAVRAAGLRLVWTRKGMELLSQEEKAA